MIRRYVVGAGLAALVMAADALTKRWASVRLADGPPIVLINGFLELTFTENPGAAFSLFENAGPFLGGAAIVVSVVLLWSLRLERPIMETVAYGLIIGGALGNLVDRLFRGPGFLDGKVIDWINLWRIPTFNVADMSITIAVVLLVIHAWLRR
ncbi:MAG: signal peptidase II [Acidimicrobiia bacterium]